MRAGGFGMWVVLLFGLITLFTAGRFAFKPREDAVGILRAMSAATVFSVLSALSSNLAAVFWKVPNTEEWAKSPDMPLIVMTGLAESLTPCMLGFTMLGLAWLMTAVGYRRIGSKFLEH